jgi:outer membrane biogenesis lipoprotein LolB
MKKIVKIIGFLASIFVLLTACSGTTGCDKANSQSDCQQKCTNSNGYAYEYNKLTRECCCK